MRLVCYDCICFFLFPISFRLLFLFSSMQAPARNGLVISMASDDGRTTPCLNESRRRILKEPEVGAFLWWQLSRSFITILKLVKIFLLCGLRCACTRRPIERCRNRISHVVMLHASTWQFVSSILALIIAQFAHQCTKRVENDGF
jgi:hypothetical protein